MQQLFFPKNRSILRSNINPIWVAKWKVVLVQKVRTNKRVLITYINNTNLMIQQFKLCMKAKKDGTKWGIILMITPSKRNTFQIRYLTLIPMSLIIYHTVPTIRDQATEAKTWTTLRNPPIGPNRNYKTKDVFIRWATPGMRQILLECNHHYQIKPMLITSK